MLSNELNPEPMKTDKPMHITLLPGARPKKVLSARRVSLRYKKEARKTIDELVERGVITPANETSDWCSLAFFVPQEDRILVRLVTDYAKLHKHINRPIHLFAHTTEILRQSRQWPGSSQRWMQCTDTSSCGWLRKAHS